MEIRVCLTPAGVDLRLAAFRQGPWEPTVRDVVVDRSACVASWSGLQDHKLARD